MKEQEETPLYRKIIIDNFDIEATIEALLNANMRLLNDRRRLRLVIPEYILLFFDRQLAEKYRAPINSNIIKEYRGIEIQFGYENKIILFHLDSPFMNELFLIDAINIP
jgi:hypothetical protein